MTELKSPPTAKPAHYRLSKATWETILAEYREGATTTELSAKWRVSEHALRRRITVHGSTKRDHGDAQAIAQAAARGEAMEAARTQEAARMTGLFDPPGEGDDEAGDPAALARTATLASGRAMRERMWIEAKALAGLAESYGRLGERAGRSGVTAATMDLDLLLQVLTDDGSLIRQRFGLWNDPPDHPDRPLKQAFWEWHHAGKRREAAWRDGLLRELWAAEERLKELGQYPPPPLPKFATAPAWERGPEDVWPGAAETGAPDSALPPDNGGA